jgi:hypothetical protein
MTNILIPLKQAIFSRGRELHQKRLVIHFDNCSIHISQVSTNWFLIVKEKLEQIQVADED